MSARSHRVAAVVAKEWAEIARNRAILWMMGLMSTIMVVLTVATDFGFAQAIALGKDMSQVNIPIPPALQHLPSAEALIVSMNEQFLFYLLLIPIMLPVYIAAHSIIGEKETRTLEPLLATPVSTFELLLGKSIAASVPAVVINWMAFVFVLLGMWAVAPATALHYATRYAWIVGMLLLSPLLALLSVLLGVLISSRVNDPRVAQQLVGVFVMPFILGGVMIWLGKVFLSVPLVLAAAFFTAILDLLVLGFAVKVFQRETILTRWR